MTPLNDKADSPPETSKYGEQEQFQEYETLAEFVLGDNAGKAETIMRRHVRRTRIAIERLPDEAFAGE